MKPKFSVPFPCIRYFDAVLFECTKITFFYKTLLQNLFHAYFWKQFIAPLYPSYISFHLKSINKFTHPSADLNWFEFRVFHHLDQLLHQGLLLAGGSIVGFIPFPTILVLCQMQAAFKIRSTYPFPRMITITP